MGPRARRVGLALIVVAIGGAAAWTGWALRDLPDVERLESWAPPQGSVLVDRGGTVLAELADERRYPLGAVGVPAHVKAAFVAAEDQRFWEHGGVDLPGIGRALLQNVTEGRAAQGASTITQQVARNLLLGDRERTLARKVREVALAVQLEARFSKERILGWYLDDVYLGDRCHGVEAAARGYFGTSAAELSLAEGALLATIVPRPSDYGPRVDPEAARARRDRLLRRMAELGVIAASDAEAAAQTELGLVDTEPPRLAVDYVEAARRELIDHFGEDRVLRGGLRVTLAVDLAFQAEAEARVAAAAAAIDPGAAPPVQGAFVAIDTVRGEVLALVGGDGDFDRATQARRPVGSTFKPLVYLAGIERRRLTAGDVFDDGPLVVPLPEGGRWEPENYGGVQVGSLTVADALASSNNRVLVRALLRIDPGMEEGLVAAFAGRMGLGGRGAPELCPGTPRCRYTLGLGAVDLTLRELVRAYSPLATGGLLLDPRLIVSVRAPDGSVVAGPPVAEPARVMEPPLAAIGGWLLRGVVLHGTARVARDFPVPVAGKTGTSDDNHDVWFVGFTPSVVAGVWFGADTPRPLGPRATGGSVALPVWLDVMRHAPVVRAAVPPLPDNALDWTGGAPGVGVPLLLGTTPTLPAGPVRPWWLGDLPWVEGLD